MKSVIYKKLKKRQNSRFLTKKRQNFRKSDKKRQSDKCKKNASNNNEKTTKNDPFVGKRQKRPPWMGHSRPKIRQSFPMYYL